MSRSRDLANLANNATGLETLTVSDITDLTATATELNYSDGVGSALQTQINSKIGASDTFNGTIGNSATLPSDTLVSVHQTGLGSDLSMTAGIAYANYVNLNFQPKSATSKFIIIVGGRYTRSNNQSGAYIGYTMKNGSLNTADITNKMVTDSHYHNYHTVLFKAESGTASVTWSVGDSLYFGAFFQSNGSNASMYEYNLTVFEYMP